MKMNNPLISVVVPSYNHSSYIEECLRSLIDQTYDRIELIVIDDGSTDDSVLKVLDLEADCSNRFDRYEFRYRDNLGLCKTINEGIEWCRGNFLVILASDDVLLPQRFSKQISTFSEKKMNEPSLVGIYSGVEMINEEGDSLKVKYGSGRFSGFKEVLYRNEFLPTPTLMLLKSPVLSVGGFNPDFKIEDFYLRLKLTEQGGKFYTMREPLVKYRQHSENLSKKTEVIWTGIQDILKEYKGKEYYSKALARSMMVQAHDYQNANKFLGLKFYLRTLMKYPLIFFSLSSFKFLLKTIIPSSLLSKIGLKLGTK